MIDIDDDLFGDERDDGDGDEDEPAELDFSGEIESLWDADVLDDDVEDAE